jgi:hypothetical protein
MTKFGPPIRHLLPTAQQEAIRRAESLNFPGGVRFDKLEFIKEPCVVIPANSVNVFKIDGRTSAETGIPGTRLFFFSPGRHSFEAMYTSGSDTQTFSASSGSISGGFSFTSSTTLPVGEHEFVFEKGKHYNMKFILGWSESKWEITEITDEAELARIKSYIPQYHEAMEKRRAVAKENQARLNEYLKFSKRNPNIFEGRWKSTSDSRVYEFRGDKLTSKADGILAVNLEGEFVYDEKTIVPLWYGRINSIQRQQKPALFKEKEVWYYVLNGDSLELTVLENTEYKVFLNKIH